MTKTAVDQVPPAEIAGLVIPWLDGGSTPGDGRAAETAGLVEALGCQLAFTSEVRIRKKSPSHLLSGGLLEELSTRAETERCTIIVIDAQLSPVQQRNLERALQVKVIDRTGLILEIFGLRARTREGVIQVELARLLYERSRLVRTWTHLERQRGGRGFLAGPGESQLEADRRMLDRQLKRLRSDLAAVRRTRSVQRAGRRRGESPVVALVGYTNAGKSALFNTLTGASAFAKDMPFATLDPTIRRFELPTAGDAALVDTVGFITDLPTHLIESFQATLEEALDADLLVHVRDRSSCSAHEQKQDVMSVLTLLRKETGRPLPPLIEAWNKADLLPPDRSESLRKIAAAAQPPAALVSAADETGLEALFSLIEGNLETGVHELLYKLTASDGDARAWLYAHGDVLSDEAAADGDLSLRVRLQPQQARRFARRFPSIVEAESA